MFKSILKITIRSLLKHKWFSIINIFGLALGFSAFIIIAFFLKYEFSWDKNNANHKRVYRVQRTFTNVTHSTDGNNISPHTAAITAKFLQNNYPEIEKISVVKENNGNFLSSGEDIQIYDENGLMASSVIFDIFTYNFIEGSPNSLSEPYNIVISKSLSDKLFPNENPLGKSIYIDKKFDLKVSGIYEDLPHNTHLRPSHIVSFSSLEAAGLLSEDNLWDGNYMTYVLLYPKQDYQVLSDKIRYLFKGFKGYEFEELHLCPIEKIHLSFNGSNDAYIIYTIFGLIGVFILAMSVFNYINLSTAKAAIRNKEIAVKKVVGSGKTFLMVQFLGETIFLSLLSIAVAFLMVDILLPYFNSIFQIDIELLSSGNIFFLLTLILFAVLTGIVAGIYPAVFMSSRNAVKLLKSKLNGGEYSMKKALVTIQFVISIFLVFLTLYFTNHIHYLINKELGFNKEGILFTRFNSSINNGDFEDLRQRLKKYPEIKEVTWAKHIPFVSYGGGTFNYEGAEPDQEINTRPTDVDYDFVKTFDMEIIEGRDFSKELKSEIGQVCIINETAAKCFGWDDPIGKRINDNKWQVVGVVKDYHYKDMHNTIEPAILLLKDKLPLGNITIALKVENTSRIQSIIEQELKTFFPNDPFEIQHLSFSFLTHRDLKVFNSLKESIQFFAFFNIFLAIMGLLGLVIFTTLRRTKEIGVRKINGSSSINIYLLLSKEYLAMLLISSIIACPMAYYLLINMPGAYKASVSVWLILASPMVILLIILLTSLYPTLKAAFRNPIEALRYE